VRPDGLLDGRTSLPETTVLSAPTVVEGERPAERGWQDKAALTGGSSASSQPAPVTEVARYGLSDTAGDRSQNDHLGRESKEHTSIWMRPGVKVAMQQLAKDTKVSFSSACAKGLEVYARAKIRDQEETLFEPRMQAMMRREIRASDNRHVPFEIKNAITAEQTRILFADLYKRQLLKEGIPLKEINKKLDNAYNLARTNVLNTRTPKFKTLVAQWWQATEDQADGGEGENTRTGEAGTGKPKA
jgi:hypothetical protein